MAKKLLRNVSTQESREYWEFVEDAALYVRAHHLCFSNMCIVTPGPCKSQNTKDRKYAREMAALKVKR